MAALKKSSIQARCLLISANKVTLPYPVYPIGIAHLTSALERHGHLIDHVDILASGGYDDLNQLLHSNHYDIIGVSIRNIDSVDSASPRLMVGDIVDVLSHVRKRSKASVILGGPGFSILPEQLLDHLDADYGIVGEGEEAFPELIDKILSGEKIEGKIFAKHLSHYPECTPKYSDSVTGYYIKHGGMLNIQTKRGCSYGCSYCSYPTIEGQKPRYRDPDAVANDVSRLTREHEARYIFFTDGVFNDHTDHHLKIAEALIRSENTTPWCAFFRPQNITKEDLQLLKKSGLSAIELGTDCTTNATLSGLRKGFTFDDVIAINELIVEEGLPCAHFVMFGGPGESQKSVLQGIQNLEKLKKCIVFAYIGLRIFPGTKLFDHAIREGLITIKTDMIQPVFYYSPEVAREFIEEELKRAFKDKVDRIFPLEEMEEYVRLFHSMGHTGPLWDLMLHRRLRQ